MNNEPSSAPSLSPRSSSFILISALAGLPSSHLFVPPPTVAELVFQESCCSSHYSQSPSHRSSPSVCSVNAPRWLLACLLSQSSPAPTYFPHHSQMVALERERERGGGTCLFTSRGFPSVQLHPPTSSRCFGWCLLVWFFQL